MAALPKVEATARLGFQGVQYRVEDTSVTAQELVIFWSCTDTIAHGRFGSRVRFSCKSFLRPGEDSEARM